MHFPWFLIDLGLAKKAVDCERVRADRWWYNKDGEHSACYHCKVIRGGRSWEGADDRPA